MKNAVEQARPKVRLCLQVKARLMQTLKGSYAKVRRFLIRLLTRWCPFPAARRRPYLLLHPLLRWR